MRVGIGRNPLPGPRARKIASGPRTRNDMAPADQWGPFVPDIDPCERRARLRSLRAIVRLLLGSRGDVLARALHCAEEGAVSIDTLHRTLSRLPSLDYRKVLASYAALTKPAAPCAA